MWYKNKVEVSGEVIFEVITQEDSLGFGYAVADVTKSLPHCHKKTSEFYTLVSGELRVYIDAKAQVLSKAGDAISIPLGAIHWAESLGETPARISVLTIPAWSSGDHILVK